MTTAVGLLVANAAATWVMVGVIWFVQRVHYPLFGRYDRADFRAVEAAHQARTVGVVFPPMLVELGTALALLAVLPPGVPAWQVWAGAALVGVWGFSTVLVQVPLHERMARDGYDPATHARLVRSNWVRTAAWTTRGVLCGVMLVECVTHG